MDQVRRIERGDALYKVNIDEPTYTVSNYPPLYTIVVAAINSVSKIPLFQSGRITSLFFFLICGIIIGLFGFRLTGNILLGVFSLLLFWGHPYVLIWSSLARVDMMALAFSLLGLWIIFRRWNSYFWTGIAIICFLASAFTKQTYLLAGPLAGFMWLWHHNRRRAFGFIFLFGSLGLLLFSIINSISKGGLYTNIVLANVNQYDLSWAIALIKQLLSISPIIYIICGIGAFMIVRSRIKNNTTPQPENHQQAFVIYGLGFYSIGAILSTLTVGKVGSTVNYFLELIVASAIWCPIVIQLIINQKKMIKIPILGLLFIQLVWILVAAYYFSRSSIGKQWQNLAFYDSLYQQVQLATQKGIVLSDDYLDMVVLSGQAIYYQPFEYGQLYNAGLWDATKLSKEIEGKKFSLILISGETLDKPCCWPKLLITAITNNYDISYSQNLVKCIPKNP